MPSLPESSSSVCSNGCVCWVWVYSKFWTSPWRQNRSLTPTFFFQDLGYISCSLELKRPSRRRVDWDAYLKDASRVENYRKTCYRHKASEDTCSFVRWKVKPKGKLLLSMEGTKGPKVSKGSRRPFFGPTVQLASHWLRRKYNCLVQRSTAI